MKFFKHLVVCHMIAAVTVVVCYHITNTYWGYSIAELFLPPKSLILFTIIYYIAFRVFKGKKDSIS